MAIKIKKNIMENNEESNVTVNRSGSLTENAAIKQTTLSKSGLLGPVKQIKHSRYKAFSKFGKVYMGEPEGTTYEKNNFIDSYTIDGAITENIKFNANGGKNCITYNEKELTISDQSFLQGGLYSGEQITTYNENGDRLMYKSFDAKGDVSFYIESIYNEAGKELETGTYMSHPSLENSKTMRSYNDEGHCIELKMTRGEKIQAWSKYRLNDKGNIVEQDNLNEDGSVKETSKYYHYYDENGDRIPQAPYIPPPSKEDSYKAKTENDHHGNWIKKITYYAGNPVSIFIREINYYGEELQKKLVAKDGFFNLPINLKDEETKPITEEEWLVWYHAQEEEKDKKLSVEDTKWLAERTPSADNFPYFAYYMLKNNEFPCQTTYVSQNVDAIALLKELTANMGAVVVNKMNYDQQNRHNSLMRYTLAFKDNPGYMVYAMQIQEVDADNYEVPAFIEAHHPHTNCVYLSQMILLSPNENSVNKDEDGIEEDLREYMEKCTLERIPDKPEIYMVEVDGKGQFSLQSHNVKEDFEIDDLDIQYGYGFEKFHDNLMERFKNESQGLVLFHGIPGTGKTYYIRHLLKEMSEANKIVIYMPPNMVDYLVDPGFMTFLQQTVSEHSADGNFCVLLIEDAEPLLASRNAETRIQGVTNLLNMTDGLLNDMLKLQIICTFNVELRQLDAALLRPGRLIARKEFKALGEIEANLLAQSLGIKHHFKAPATLSEIYAMLKDKNTLIHDEY